MLNTEDFYLTILDRLYEGVYFVDTERKITYWNRAAQAITGYESGVVLGSHCYDNILMHVDDEGNLLCMTGCPLAKTIRDGQEREVEVYFHHKNGQRVSVSVRVAPVFDENGKVRGAVEFFTDNSSRVAALEQISELQKAALLDALTGVGNRRYTEMQLNTALEEWKLGLTFGVLFVDLDQLKEINDHCGHATGDRVLKAVAETLRGNVHAYDFVGRWGGDEFVVILSKVTPGSFQASARKLLHLVETAAVVAHDGPRAQRPGQEALVRATVSIGATLAGEGDTMESVLERADQLMYVSKSEGRNRVTVG